MPPCLPSLPTILFSDSFGKWGLFFLFEGTRSFDKNQVVIGFDACSLSVLTCRLRVLSSSRQAYLPGLIS
jgi:hypothetical protein